jgi:hypothetical protein
MVINNIEELKSIAYARGYLDGFFNKDIKTFSYQYIYDDGWFAGANQKESGNPPEFHTVDEYLDQLRISNEIVSEIILEESISNIRSVQGGLIPANFLEKYSYKEQKFLANSVDKFWSDNSENFEYADNFRLAKVGDSKEEEQYFAIKEQGCCGFHDMEFGPSPCGAYYNYGFNYGH